VSEILLQLVSATVTQISSVCTVLLVVHLRVFANITPAV